MRLWVGLGNPGAKYAGNRHNVGFMALERIAADHGFAPWRAKFQGTASEGTLNGTKILLLRPGTFMNLSGQSVGEAMRFYRLAPGDVTVFHDELDLASGRVRLKSGGGHAGHNGLRSIHAHIGEAYHRVRIGIGHPGSKERVTGHVLSDFAKAETEMLEEMLRGISDGAGALAAGDGTRFLNAVSLRTAPPRASTGGRKGGQEAPAPAESRSPGPTQDAKAPQEAASQAAADPKSLLQRLADKFR